MDNNVEHKIRKRAYDLWVQDGQIPGRSDDYWLQAEREILGTPNEEVRPGSDSGPVMQSAEAIAPKPTRRAATRTAGSKTAKSTGSPRSKRSS